MKSRYVASGMLVLLLLLASIASLLSINPNRQFEAEYRYMIVSCEGSKEWEAAHTISLIWRGRSVPLPVVFRANHRNHLTMGASADGNSIVINDEKGYFVVDPPDTVKGINCPSSSVVIRRDVRGADKLSTVTLVAVQPLSELSGGMEAIAKLSGTLDAQSQNLSKYPLLDIDEGKTDHDTR